MGKSADAFRTISEVADWLETPAHVLRFWESKFPQIKPVKRAGGRRYYRPADMALIGGIKKLLHDDGMTIKGVQKILRDQGVKHVAALSPPIDGETPQGDGDTIEATATPGVTAPEESATVLPFQPVNRPADESQEPAPERLDDAADADQQGQRAATPPAPDASPPLPDDATEAGTAESDLDAGTAAEDVDATERPAAATPEPRDPTDAPEVADEAPAAPAPEDTGKPATVPAFLRRGAPSPDAAPPLTAPQHDPRPEAGIESRPDSPPGAADTPPEPEPLRTAQIDVPPDPDDDSITAPPGLLATIAARKGRPLAPEARSELRALRDRLAAVHARQTDTPRTAATD
ncbi:MerR family transcriptional regulator [Aquicoccus sp.]|uniref:MerR family transcriptional regulator n=1 Tax=Aquicoccus sp. TaxID=2055851 RepID=UPI0035692092